MEASSRLRAFIRAARFRGAPEVPVNNLVSSVEDALVHVGAQMPEDDRALLKLAVTSIAYHGQVAAIARGELQLDFREQAILDAVVERLREKLGT